MKTLRTTLLLMGLLTMFSTNIAQAAYLNLGTLDVRPVAGQETNPDWFVEYANQGQTIIRYVQIANFSPDKKQVEVYAADGSKDLSTNFLVKTKEETSQKIAPWMSIPAQSLTLNPGETKIVPVKMTIPQNAGVGMHTGAIIVREATTAAGTMFHVEKGVRIYMNIKGSVINNAVVNQGVFTQNFSNLGLNFILENKGTTDFDTPVTFALKDLNGQTVNEQKLDGYARPGEKTQINFNLDKPAFGIYQLVLSSQQPINGETTTTIQTVAIVPLWAILLLAAMALAAGFVAVKEKKSAVVQAAVRSFSLQKVFSFLGILLASGMICLPLMNANGGHPLFADALATGNPDSYEVTVKWGNLRKLVLSRKATMQWSGQIRFSDAQVSIVKTLNLEANDAINLVKNGTAVDFSLVTDTSNDGVVLKVTPNSAVEPKLTFENYPTNTLLTYSLNKVLGGRMLIPNKLFAATIDVVGITSPTHGAPLNEQNATPEVGATPEAQATPEVNINIPELRSIFADIPSTPEVLSEFILTSDYVKRITTENASTNIIADPALISALAATPEIIQEIVATPNLNFTFIPSSTVTFPPQEFSFQQDKTATQNLGTIIFVQNKETPWNTYIGTTNFVPLSGNGVIAAGNLTIIPGQAKSLTKKAGGTINEGGQKTMSGTFDKSILVNVQPDSILSKNIFVMNPKLRIKIPRGTAPGKYKGLLTITSL